MLKAGLCQLNGVDHSAVKNPSLILSYFSLSFFSITSERFSFFDHPTYVVPQGSVPGLVHFIF